MEAWNELVGLEAFPMGGKPGVYVILDHRKRPKYVGKSDRVWGRLGDKHVSGSEKSHAIQRAYREAIPDKKSRTEFIRDYVSAYIIETESLLEAENLEQKLIRKYEPAWNVQGIPGKKVSSPGVLEPYDEEFMQAYVQSGA